MTTKKFLGGIDDDEEDSGGADGAERQSEDVHEVDVQEVFELDEAPEGLQEDLNEALRGEVVLNSDTLDKVAKVLYRHPQVLQTLVNDRVLSVIYKEYSVVELENILLRVDGIEYGGTFAGRKDDETGVVYSIEQ